MRVTEVMKANLESEAAALRQELAKQEQVGGLGGQVGMGARGRLAGRRGKVGKSLTADGQASSR